jgi:hypothetical protein
VSKTCICGEIVFSGVDAECYASDNEGRISKHRSDMVEGCTFGVSAAEDLLGEYADLRNRVQVLEDEIEDLEADVEPFTCPLCGGHEFGTYGADDWDNAIGVCRTCNFKWRRSEDAMHKPTFNLVLERFDTYVNGLRMNGRTAEDLRDAQTVADVVAIVRQATAARFSQTEAFVPPPPADTDKLTFDYVMRLFQVSADTMRSMGSKRDAVLVEEAICTVKSATAWRFASDAPKKAV